MNNKKTLKILVVEDNPVDVLWVESRLEEDESARFDITHVESLEEAEQTLGKQRFEIILLDLGLPDSQGIETFFRMQSLASDIPIVVITGLDDEALAIEAVSNGAQDYICKDRWDAQLIGYDPSIMPLNGIKFFTSANRRTRLLRRP